MSVAQNTPFWRQMSEKQGARVFVSEFGPQFFIGVNGSKKLGAFCPRGREKHWRIKKNIKCVFLRHLGRHAPPPPPPPPPPPS
jgi:hypothetical protein